jgi:rhamnose utilization protein RhaD (predicted bifunctional aldolase and dehydrogenase)
MPFFWTVAKTARMRVVDSPCPPRQAPRVISDSQLRELAAASARIGRDPLLIQGPGGNTSIKDADELWVKASGLWLSDADDRQVFVPLARAALVDPDGSPRLEIGADAVIAERNAADLRPSIETALHALMPHPVVFHAHAVNAMATAVLADGEARAGRALAGLSWRWVPYCRPGADLARGVLDAIAGGGADVLLLQNHGVVVGADTPAAAEALLHEVEARLDLPARPLAADAALATLDHEDFELHPAASAIAHDDVAVAVLTRYALVPDQIVFLGGAVPSVGSVAQLTDTAARCAEATGVSPALILIPGVGGVAARNRSAGAETMIGALIEIARRIPAGADVRGLDNAAIASLLGWDAEHHRRALDAARSRIV